LLRANRAPWDTGGISVARQEEREVVLCLDPSYASPIAVDLGGTRQIVTQSQSNIVAAMLQAGAFVVSLTSDADLVVSKAGPAGLEMVRKYQAADSQTWAHPVLVGRRLLVKDATTLALWIVEQGSGDPHPTQRSELR
jgi:hypothetical protein